MANIEEIKNTVDTSLDFARQGIEETHLVDEKIAAYGRFLLGIRDACGTFLAELDNWEQVQNVVPIAPYDEASSVLIPLRSENESITTAVSSFDEAYRKAHEVDDRLFGENFSYLKELLSDARQMAEDLSGASAGARNALEDTSVTSVIGHAQTGIQSLLDYRNTL